MLDVEKLLLLAGCVFVAAFLVLLYRRWGGITPFHFATVFFAAECFLTVWPQLAADPYGRTKYWDLGWGVVLSMIGVSVLVLLLVPFLKFNRAGPSMPARIEFRVAESVIFASAFGLSALSTTLSLVRLGTFPLLALSAASVQEQIGYAQVFQGFTTFVAWGSTRLMAVLLGVMVVFSDLRLVDFVRIKRTPVLLFLGALVLNLLDGQRSLLIYPLFVLLFAISCRFEIPLRRILAIGLTLMLVFVAVGFFRARHVTDHRLSRSTGNDVADTAVAWFVTYLEPNIYNLNNLVLAPPKKTYGLLLLSEIVPDRLLQVVTDIPPTAPEYMDANRLFAQPGLTFRTILADFVPDFGLLGSFLITCVIFIACCIAQRKARISPIHAYVYLALSLGVAAAPFHNLLVGITGIMPWAGILLIRVQRSPR